MSALHRSNPALGPTQPSDWLVVELFLRHKVAGHEADYLPLYTAEVEYMDLYLHFTIWHGS
jgi:hypothetical protein